MKCDWKSICTQSQMSIFFSRRQIVEWQLIYWSFFPRLTRNICFNIPSKIRATELYILAPWDCASRLVVIQQQHKKRRWNCDTLRNLCFPCRLKGSIFLPKTATWSLNVQPPSETFIGRLTKNLPKASKVKGTPTQSTIHLCVSKMVDPKVSLECNSRRILMVFQSCLFFSLRLSPRFGIGLEFRSSIEAQFSLRNYIPKCRFKCQVASELNILQLLKNTIPYPQYDITKNWFLLRFQNHL